MNLEVLPEEVAHGHLALQSHSVVLTCRKETRCWRERQNVMFLERTPLTKPVVEEKRILI